MGNLRCIKIAVLLSALLLAVSASAQQVVCKSRSSTGSYSSPQYFVYNSYCPSNMIYVRPYQNGGGGKSAVDLSGQLNNMANSMGQPVTQSKGTQGLLNGLRRSLLAPKQVNLDDPASLRAAAVRALQKGDTESAKMYIQLAEMLED